MIVAAPQYFPSRAAGLDRLQHFVPFAAEPYATGRNLDPGPTRPGAVSRLSPYLRYRLLTEREVVEAVLARHNLSASGKFVQEVLWRTYWKGWLELRPSVWRRFLAERDRQQQDYRDPLALADAEAGRTGIEGFDHWARELVETGDLHNHARMWFASIWIFTLRLPWELGADFFLRHLVDADPASNTLSWRWVAGLQTVGKTYLATRDNIARCTDGRFAPDGLATVATPLREPPIEPARTLSPLTPAVPGRPSLLLVSAEDMHPESCLKDAPAIRAAIIAADDDLLWGEMARAFVNSAAEDAASRAAGHDDCSARIASRLDSETLVGAARDCGAEQIITPYAPVGPVADRLAALAPKLAREGIALVQVRRSWDTHCWPHATKGFFPFREQIPELLRLEGII